MCLNIDINIINGTAETSPSILSVAEAPSSCSLSCLDNTEESPESEITGNVASGATVTVRTTQVSSCICNIIGDGINTLIIISTELTVIIL